MHPAVLKISVILISIGLAVFFVFFSANDYQNNPDLFLERKIANIESQVIPVSQKFYEEYEAGEYCLKNNRLQEAYNHFYNVYYNYPTISKGYLKLKSYYYINDLRHRLKIYKEQGPDTEVLVKKYFDSK